MPRIDIGEVRYFVEQFLRESQKLKEALTNYRKAVAKIIADDEIKGEIADSAKKYYQTVHYPIVDTTKACMTDAEEILKKYTTDFHDQVDPSMNARIDSDELQALQGDIRKCQNRYEDLLVKMKSMAGGSSLGQQIGMQLGMQTAMGQLQQEMQIIERYLEFDSSHQNVMYDVAAKLHQVKQGLTEIQSSKAFNTVSHTFNTKNMSMGWLEGLTPAKEKDPYAKYEKTLQGSYWVLTKNGKTDAEAAEATIAYNKGINDGTIKVPRDENSDFDAERIKGALEGYDPISGNNLTSMQSFSVLAGIASGMVAIRGRGRVYKKSNLENIEANLKNNDVYKVNKGKEHIGTLKKQEVRLPDVYEQPVNYTKRDRVEFNNLRKDFDNGIRKKFLKSLAADNGLVATFEKVGLSAQDIKKMEAGKVPTGYQVHHKLPLDDGGTNDFKNLVLIKNDPFHKVLTNTQKTLTKDLNVGETVKLEWPIPDGSIYPKK
ncbi:T7SS effector LXG polymorphic toxin [Listeria weihenstephanensis]|uniref:T7SS effector LXG polymorphic toxin n=1 Tax=Listeria weihenstephanensis TaxID=1006155 RepID=UPI001E5B785E|nr:T7SS effector LXG polymorphic toxin [Listeria weihenstephanensis]